MTLDDIKKLISTRDERIAQLEAERDALAAALVKARDLAGTASCYEVDAALSTEAGSDVFGSPGIARKSLVKRAKNAWAEFDAIIDGDPTAILAARDARMKRAGAMAALRGLLNRVIDDICLDEDDIRFAIAALEQKGEQG